MSFKPTFKQNVKCFQRSPQAEIPKGFCVLSFWSDLESLSNLSFGEENKKGKNDLRSLSRFGTRKSSRHLVSRYAQGNTLLFNLFFFPLLFMEAFWTWVTPMAFVLQLAELAGWCCHLSSRYWGTAFSLSIMLGDQTLSWKRGIWVRRDAQWLDDG